MMRHIPFFLLPLLLSLACSDPVATKDAELCASGESPHPITGACPDSNVRDNSSRPPERDMLTLDMGATDGAQELDLSQGMVDQGGSPNVVTPPGGCTPGESFGCDGEGAEFICNMEGTDFESLACDSDSSCLPGAGCTDMACLPGTQACEGSTQLKLCNAEGSGYEPPTSCAEGEVCSRGSCTTVCELGKYRSSYVGCEYWTLDLDQHQEMTFGSNPADAVPHSVVISNPNDRPATIAFRSWAPGVSVNVPDPVVPPKTSKVFRMPRLDIEKTSISSNSIQITSTLPITAHQFNPLGNENVFSNDASLLLPANTLGKEYYALNVDSRPQVCFMGTCFDPYYAYITVLATEPGETRLNVTPTARIEAGVGIPTIPPGAAKSFTLQRGQVLNLQVGETSLSGNLDLSGTHIIADKPVAVFSGHEGSVVGEPGAGDTCCAEHLEQQLFPLKDWGKRYMAALSPGRGIKKDHWRIIAGEDNVTLTTNPPQAGAHNVTLNKGEFVKLYTADSFEITATGIVQVGQFLIAQDQTSEVQGDPAFVLNVPIERFRKDYIVLTPQGYSKNYLLVVRKAGAMVTRDAQPIADSLFTSIGSGEYEFAHIQVSPGVFSLESLEPFSVSVYGYDNAVSYGYPGGLNLVGEQLGGP